VADGRPAAIGAAADPGAEDYGAGLRVSAEAARRDVRYGPRHASRARTEAPRANGRMSKLAVVAPLKPDACLAERPRIAHEVFSWARSED